MRMGVGWSWPKLADSITIGFEPPGSITAWAYALTFSVSVSRQLLAAEAWVKTKGNT
jgi:hypothetical protein